MNRPLNVLVSGPGLIGRKHIEIIRSRPEWNLTAIVAPSTSVNQGFADRCKVPLYVDMKDAILKEDVDVAIISSPNSVHHHQALTCIDHEIPFLVEKPLAANLEEAATVVKMADSHNIVGLVGHHRTYSPLLTAAKKFLDSPQFGSVVCIQGSALFYKPDHYFSEGKWRSEPGGGPILINLIHEIGVMRYLCGEIKSVSAISTNSNRHFRVEDTVSMTLEFQTGALGTFLLSDSAASSKSWEMTSGENPLYPNFPREHCYHFAGTRGSLDFPSMDFRAYQSDTSRSWWRHFDTGTLPVTHSDPLILQLEHLYDVVMNGTHPKVSLRDGYQNMRVIDAIVKSSQTGRPVAIIPET